MAKAGSVAALGLVAAAQAAPLAASPLLMQALGLGADRLGVALAAGLLATMAPAPRAGALADRVRPARAARRGLAVICAASVLLCGYTALVLGGAASAGAAVAVVLGTRIANGVGIAVLHPSAQAWLWAGAGDEEGAALQDRASAAQNVGRFAGPVGVALVGGLGAVWTLAAVAAVCACALLALCLTPDPAAGADRAPAARRDDGPPGPSPRGMWLVLAALFALHPLGGGAQFLLGPLLVACLDLGAAGATRWAGWLMALAAVAAVAGNVAGRRALGRRRAAAGAGSATAGAVVLAPFGDLASVAAGVAAVAAGIGAAVPSAMAGLMRRSPARGRTAGRTAATQAAAYAAAAPVCGALFAFDPALAAASLPLPAAAALALFVAAGRAESEAGTNVAGRRGDAGRHPG